MGWEKADRETRSDTLPSVLAFFWISQRAPPPPRSVFLPHTTQAESQSSANRNQQSRYTHGHDIIDRTLHGIGAVGSLLTVQPWEKWQWS